MFKQGLIAFCFLTLLSTGISVVSPYVNGLFIDCISYAGSKDEVIRLAIITIILGLLSVVFSYISQVFTAKLKTNFSYKMTMDLISYVQKTPFLLIQKLDPAYLTTRITGDVDSVLSFFLNNIVSFFLSIIVGIVSLIVLFRLNTILFFVSLFCIPAYIGLYYFLKGPLFKTRKKYIEIKNKFTAKITEQLYLIEEIKTDGDYEKSQNRIKSTFTNVFILYLKAIKVSSSFSSIDSIISLLFQSINLIWGGLLVSTGELTIGQYTIINVYFSYVMDKLRYFLSFGQSYQETKASFDRIQELFLLEPEHNGNTPINNIKKIEVKDISFDFSHYDAEENTSLISHLNMDLEKGEMICLIGDNGSGKSTLINLILGIIQKNVTGEIRYNDEPLSNIDINKVKREVVAVVKQNPRYPKMSIIEMLYENCIGCDPVSKAKIAMEKWGITAFYYNNQFDLDNSLDKEMSEFSGGERQKLALLFAIIKEPDVLILDEPSSAMDQNSVKILLEFISKYKREHILLCVTHSAMLIKAADSVVKLDS